MINPTLLFLLFYLWPIRNINGSFKGPLMVSATVGDYREGARINGQWNPNYSRFHRGIDIPATNGTPVYSLISDSIKYTLQGDGVYVGNFWYIHLKNIIDPSVCPVVTGILDTIGTSNHPTKIGEVMDFGAPGPRNDHLHFQIGEPSTDGPFYNPLNYIIYNKEVLCLGYL